jgi:hypothetical protein
MVSSAGATAGAGAPNMRPSRDAPEIYIVSNLPAIFNILIPASLVLVFGALSFGMYALFRGGDFERSWSNRMMRFRVLFQFIAVIIVMAALFFVEQAKGR